MGQEDRRSGDEKYFCRVGICKVTNMCLCISTSWEGFRKGGSKWNEEER